jgi:L-iditol 2-dehydrogenase
MVAPHNPAAMRVHVLEEPGKLTLREAPRPEPGPGEIVVRVRAALTCGTDVKAFERGHPKWPMPTPFGHEFSGEVAAIGAGVGGLREGDAIMAAPTAPCGECFFCVRHQENLCETIMETMVLGAFADYVRLPARVVRTNVFPKHPGRSFASAALLEPLACVVHGLARAVVGPADTAVLLGAGAISLLHLCALRVLGVGRVFVVGRNPNRAAHAHALGADEVLLDGMEEARERVLAATAGRGADIVIECTGQIAVWDAAPGFARRGGQVIFFGGCRPGSTLSLDALRFHYDELRVMSPFHFTPGDVRRSWEMLGDPGFPADQLITATYPLADLGTALARHRAGDGVKFAIEP